MITRTSCRGCASKKLRLVHFFGAQPLAGEFPFKPESEHVAKRYDLDLSQCDACGLLQVTNVPPIENVFHSDYRYASSTVPALLQHFNELANWFVDLLPPRSRILEFGCNDGILLANLQGIGFECVGVDASENVANLARRKGLLVHTGFMSEKLVRSKNLEKQFDLVTCSNVLAHIDDVFSAVMAARLALKEGGYFCIEVHDANALIQESQFDTIYHEHLTYFSELTLRRLVERAGFIFLECAKTPMHGGGLRLICKRSEDRMCEAPRLDQSELVRATDLSSVILRCGEDVRELFRVHGPLDGYGAAGRSQMFINITGTADCFCAVYDDSFLRQNRFIVGTDIPILPFSHSVRRACIILSWNYAESIAQRIDEHYDAVLTILPAMKCWK
jgi:SAM-dependent methyltransferase